MQAKGLFSVIMTGAVMMGVLSGCGSSEPDVVWVDQQDGQQESYTVSVSVAHGGKLNIKSEQVVEDDGTLNFVATPAQGDHEFTGLMVDGVEQPGVVMPDGQVKISLQNINHDMTVVVMCDNEGGAGDAGAGGGAVGGGAVGGGPVGDGDTVASTYSVTVQAELIDDNAENKSNLENVTTNSEIVFDTDDVGSINFGGTATEDTDYTITIQDDPYYEVASVVAYIGNSTEPVELEDQGKGIYKLAGTEIDGNVKIDVTYDQLEAVLVMKDDRDKYVSPVFQAYVGDTVSAEDLAKLEVQFKDSDDQVVRREPYQEGNWTVVYPTTDGKFTADYAGYAVSVPVTWHDPQKPEREGYTAHFTVKVSAMSSDAAEGLKNYFDKGYLESHYDDTVNLWHVNTCEDWMVEKLTAEDSSSTTGQIWNTEFVEFGDKKVPVKYYYNYKRVDKVLTAETGENSIQHFYDTDVRNAINDSDSLFKRAYVYMSDINEEDGTCTMWVVWFAFSDNNADQ